MRAIEDGRYVFCHAYQSLNNGESKWVTADLFDTDSEGRVIEHWDVIQEYVDDTASGRSMVDGPTEVEDLDKTAENKAIVQGFIDDILMGGKIDKITDYISTQQYDQHNPLVKDKLEGLQQAMSSGMNMHYIKVHHLIGQGNFVVSYSHVQLDGDDYAVFDLFRLKGGKIVEHWDVQEKILPKSHWNNSGKF